MNERSYSDPALDSTVNLNIGHTATLPIAEKGAGELPNVSGEWKLTVEEFSFAGCHYNSSCD